MYVGHTNLVYNVLTFELELVLVALYAGGENWFGVDAVATRHKFSLFKLKKIECKQDSYSC
jgi:hypothetical protein